MTLVLRGGPWALRAVLAFTLVAASPACSGPAANGATTPSNSSGLASCAAEVDHTASQCPALVTSRTFAINECERTRNEFEPMDCGPAFAAYVQCASSAAIPCDTGEPLGCDDEQAGYGQCQSAFVGRTSCPRLEAQDQERCGGTTPYAFGCLGAMPKGCVSAEAGAIVCCPSFATGPSAFANPPVVDTSSQATDASGTNFTDPSQCLGFTDGIGWKRCAESTECTCQHCATELAACANDHACVFSWKCKLGIGTCNPNEDPLFNGYGQSATLVDKLQTCMQGASCTQVCAASGCDGAPCDGG